MKEGFVTSWSDAGGREGVTLFNLEGIRPLEGIYPNVNSQTNEVFVS